MKYLVRHRSTAFSRRVLSPVEFDDGSSIYYTIHASIADVSLTEMVRCYHDTSCSYVSILEGPFAFGSDFNLEVQILR